MDETKEQGRTVRTPVRTPVNHTSSSSSIRTRNMSNYTIKTYPRKKEEKLSDQIKATLLAYYCSYKTIFVVSVPLPFEFETPTLPPHTLVITVTHVQYVCDRRYNVWKQRSVYLQCGVLFGFTKIHHWLCSSCRPVPLPLQRRRVRRKQRSLRGTH